MGRVKSVIESVKNAKPTNPKYDMTAKDIGEILKIYSSPCDLIVISFKFGYLQGVKATKSALGKSK